MRALRRAALIVLVAVSLAVAGALGATAFHWYVVEPSDDELRSAATGLDLGVLSAPAQPVTAEKWAPSFDRGLVLWEAEVDDTVSGADVASELAADGWEVRRVESSRGYERVAASRDGLDLGLWLNATTSGGTRATVTLDRGDVAPSLTVTVVAGTAVGALVGGSLMPWTERRARRRLPTFTPQKRWFSPGDEPT